MPQKRFHETMFCRKREVNKLHKCDYGLAEDSLVPPGFQVGDMVSLHVRTEAGHKIHELELTEETFAGDTVELPDGDQVATKDLWSVYRIAGMR